MLLGTTARACLYAPDTLHLQAGACRRHCHCLRISLHICIHTDTDTDTGKGKGTDTDTDTDTDTLVGGWRSVVRGSVVRGSVVRGRLEGVWLEHLGYR